METGQDYCYREDKGEVKQGWRATRTQLRGQRGTQRGGRWQGLFVPDDMTRECRVRRHDSAQEALHRPARKGAASRYFNS